MKSLILNSKLSNESGYSFVPCLALVAFIIIGFSVVLQRAHQQFDRIKLKRTQQEARFIQRNLTMIFANRSVCQANINDGALGKTLSDLTAHQTQLFFPNTSGSLAGFKLAPGSHFRNTEISSLRFSVPNRVSPSDSSYIATLNVGVRVGTTAQTLSIAIPFYFLTNSSGDIKDCFATQLLPPGLGQPALALEDALCKLVTGNMNFSYRPFEQICFDMSSEHTTSFLLTGINATNNRAW